MRVAVLALRQEDAGLAQSELDALADQLRQQVIESLPSTRYDVITKENIEVLLQNVGKDLADIAGCDSACETAYGRELGADYVISGTIKKVFGKMRVSLACHQTRLDSPKALAMARCDVQSASQLVDGVDKSGLELLLRAFPGEVAVPEPAPGMAPAPQAPDTPSELAAMEDQVRSRLGLDGLRLDPDLAVSLEISADIFVEGEELKLSLECSERCFLAVFNLYANDTVALLFPQGETLGPPLDPGATLVLPPGDGVTWKVGLLPGDREAIEALHVVALREPTPLPAGVQPLWAGTRALEGGISALASWQRGLPPARFAQVTRAYGVVRR
jgi:hypothetical protein